MFEAKIIVEGEVKTAKLNGFTKNSLKIEIGNTIYYMSRNLFNVWQKHSEIGFYSVKHVTSNGTEFMWLE